MSCPSGQSCSNGMCQPTGGTANYGAPCTSNAQCSGIGAGAICKQVTATGNATYSGGYCTKVCAGPGECGTTAECIGGGAFGEDNICAAFCGVGSYVCRSGYACYPIPAGDICWLDPLPTPPSAPPNLIGNACTSDAACQANGTFTPGICYPATSPSTGAPTGFTGGYCSAQCDHNNPSDPICSSTGVCVGFSNSMGQAFGLCMNRCSAPEGGQSNCRTSYICETATSAGEGGCLPRCDNPGWGCPTGTTCNTGTGYCQ